MNEISIAYEITIVKYLLTIIVIFMRYYIQMEHAG